MSGTVLITGAAGFIGTHLVERQLALGRHVRALDLRPPQLTTAAGDRLQVVIGDVADGVTQAHALGGVDLVFHLASAHLSVRMSEKAYWRVNVHCLPELLERARQAGVRRFVHVSTVGVFGDITAPPADESHPCRPLLTYERTKYEGELAVKRFSADTGFAVVIVRPAWVYGPGCPRTRKLFSAVGKGRFIFAGHGNTLRHCLYIEDLLDGLELCATKDVAIGRTYILADGEPVTLAALVAEIARVLNVPPPRLHVPVWLLAGAGRLAELVFRPLGKEPPLSSRSLRFFTGNTAFDTGRARAELGFMPRYSIATGLRAYATWLATEEMACR
jgi:nucleoside-diphosphate-sugar epimerase